MANIQDYMKNSSNALAFIIKHPNLATSMLKAVSDKKKIESIIKEMKLDDKTNKIIIEGASKMGAFTDKFPAEKLKKIEVTGFAWKTTKMAINTIIPSADLFFSCLLYLYSLDATGSDKKDLASFAAGWEPDSKAA